jgi:hypothetical protein
MYVRHQAAAEQPQQSAKVWFGTQSTVFSADAAHSLYKICKDDGSKIRLGLVRLKYASIIL